MFNNELFLLKYGKYMKQLLSIKEKALKIVKSVRGSTAAGINISLLPRNCNCGGFACSAVLGRDLFPLAFVAFGSFGTGEGPLWYGICATCSKRLPTVRDAFSEALRAQNRLLRYGRNIRCAEQPPVVHESCCE